MLFQKLWRELRWNRNFGQQVLRVPKSCTPFKSFPCKTVHLKSLPFKKVDDLKVELLFSLPFLLRRKLEVSVQHACAPVCKNRGMQNIITDSFRIRIHVANLWWFGSPGSGFVLEMRIWIQLHVRKNDNHKGKILRFQAWESISHLAEGPKAFTWAFKS